MRENSTPLSRILRSLISLPNMLWMVAIAGFVFSACATYAQTDALDHSSFTQGAPHALKISSGDLLEVTVFDTPELSGKLRVNEQGQIVIPVAGAVSVLGKTADEAAVAIQANLKGNDVLHDPHVSVFIAEYATQGVTVTGEVKNPGIYPLLGSHNLPDLVAAAGGLTATASKTVTVIHKADPNEPQVVQLDTRPGSIAARIDVQPGDTITVSRAGVVYVVGDVAKPGGFLIETNDRLTVLQALALAQGTNKTATSNGARLIRKVQGVRQEVPVALKRILANKSPDIVVEDGDILFVPSSRSKIVAYRGVDAAVNTTIGLLVYR